MTSPPPRPGDVSSILMHGAILLDADHTCSKLFDTRDVVIASLPVARARDGSPRGVSVISSAGSREGLANVLCVASRIDELGLFPAHKLPSYRDTKSWATAGPDDHPPGGDQ